MASFLYQAPAWAADRRYSNNPQYAKYVLGVPRDVVSLLNNRIRICSPQAVCIDGGPILAVDSAARPMQAFPYGAGYTLPLGEYHFSSTHNAKSYDARYFGPVPITRVIGAITPLVTG